MDVIMPQLGETVEEGTVTVWHKKPGERVEKDEVLFEIETAKVGVEIPAPMSGFLTQILVEEGQTVKVGTRLAVIADSPEAPGRAAPANPAAPFAAASASGTPAMAAKAAAKIGKRGADGRPLSPVVRKLLDEHQIDPGTISGTGAGGRITRRDVLEHVERLSAPARRPAVTAEAKSTSLAPSARAGDQDKTVIPFSRIRKLTAEHMVRSKATSPHVLQAVEVDFSKVEQTRLAQQASWEAREGYPLTYLPFVARAVCLSIVEFPQVNASVEGDSLVVHRRVNLGIAVDLNFNGLMVPVVKDAQRKGVRELARGIRDLAVRAREGKLNPDELNGGTYTVSNSGPFGTLITAPIIVQPQVAILSTDGIRKRPVVVEGPQGDTLAIRPVGVLAQSFDHRAFDGAYSAAFLRRLKHILETHDWAAEFA